MKIFASYNIKGGVGKTATAVNLACLAAREGARTLVWDLDPQGATSFYLRIPPQLPGGVRTITSSSDDLLAFIKPSEFDNLWILPADFSYRDLDLELEAAKKPRKRLARKLKTFRDHFDLVLIDCPPSVSLVSEAVLRAADALVVPVVPTTLSMRTLAQVQEFVQTAGKHQPELLPFLSMVDRRKRMHLDICDACLADPVFLRTVIPSASIIERMGLTRAPVAATQPSQPAARAFASLWHEVATRLAIGPGY